MHLQSVIERFSHDALLSLEAAAELTDTALSSSVSALKTSGSIRSLNSLKKRPLTEIAEDASEIPISDTQPSTPIETPSSDSDNLIPLSATTEKSINSEDKESTSTTKAIRGPDGDFTNNGSVTERPSTAVDVPDSQRRPSLTPSDSAHSTGSKSLHSVPTPSSDTFAYLYKPKVKLAPRPVEESRHSSPYVRPTSSLPAGVQIQSRERTTISPVMPPPNSARVTNFSLSPTDRYTNGFVQTHVSNNSPMYDNRPISRGSTTTMPASIRSNEEPTITPEKQRLMKALQKRRQQQKARQLAREGKFDDEDVAVNEGSGHANESDDFAISNPARSTSPQRLEKTLPVTQTSHADQIPSSHQDTEEDTNPSVPDTARPISTIRAVPLLQDELSASAETESGNPEYLEFLANDPVGSINGTSKNLQHTPLSILQFPNWSESKEHDYNTRHDYNIEHDDSSKTVMMLASANGSEEDNVSVGYDHQMDPQFESYRPLVLDLSQEPALSNMNISVDNEPVLEPPELGTTSSYSGISPQVSTDLKTLETSHGGNEIAQHDAEVPYHDLQETSAETVETADSVDQTPHEQNPPVDITNSINHNAMDDIHVPLYKMPTDAQGVNADSETNAESIPVRTVENDGASLPVSTPWFEQQNCMGSPLSKSDQSGDSKNTRDMHTFTGHRDTEMNSDLIAQPTPTGDQPNHPTISTTRNSTSHSEAPSLSEEDSLLDELDSATVQEATSLKLPRTPPTSFSPTFARQIDAQRDNVLSIDGNQFFPPATISVPSENSQNSPQILESLDASPISPLHSSISESPTRTITPDASASLSQPAGQDDSSPNLPSFSAFGSGSRQSSLSPPPAELERPVSRKSAVSSLISQRIKAFEDKFSAPSSPQQAPTSAVKAQIVTLRKVSLNTPSQQAQSSIQADRAASSSYPTPSPSPHNFAQKLGFGKAVKKENLPKDAVMRDKATKNTKSNSNNGVTDSPPSTSVPPEKPIIQPEVKSMRSIFSSKSRKKKTNGDASSPPLNRESLPSSDTSAHEHSVSPHSNSSESIQPSRAMSSTESLTSDGERKDSKKRAGLLKRLSTMGSSSRRSIAETIIVPVSEQTVTEYQAPETTRNWRSSVTLGELNIQFPDTLVSSIAL